MKISVIVCVKNMEIYLPQTLNSLKRQSFGAKNFEVVIVDGNSSDSTPEIIRQYCRECANFRAIEPREGLFASRNAGMDAARGKYITFLNGDDLYSRHFLERMFETAERRGAALTVGKMKSFDIFGSHTFSSSAELSRRKLTDRFDTDLIWNPSVSNKLFLLSRVREMGLRFPDCSAAQDAAFSLSFALKSDLIACCPRSSTELRSGGPDRVIEDTPEDLRHYSEAYQMLRRSAEESFDEAEAFAESEFDLSELKKQRVAYLDELRLKELTVMLHRHYRRFHFKSDAELEQAAQAVYSLMDGLSPNAARNILNWNADIFFEGRLSVERNAPCSLPRVSIVISGERTAAELERQLDSVFAQSLPFFEIIADISLQTLFSQKYKNNPFIRFIEEQDGADIKQTALKGARAKYILFLDEFCLLDFKFLKRHYDSLESRHKMGFSASPTSRFDGKNVSEYRFCTLSFFQNSEAERSDTSPSFVLDLLLCNKLIRISHLKGIHFSFSGNSVFDAYKLYESSSFKKLLMSGIYLSLPEEELIERIRGHEALLPPECSAYFRNRNRLYKKNVVRKRRRDEIARAVKKSWEYALDSAGRFAVSAFRHFPLRRSVLFYTERSSDGFSESLDSVFKAYPGKKEAIALMRPHSLWARFKIYKSLLTSRVIVTDDTLHYLKNFRLREGQRVFQLWHGCGVFRRFALDAPIHGTRLEEMRKHSQYSAVAASSEDCRQYFAHAFGISPEVVLPVGTPKTDLLLSSEQTGRFRSRLIKKHPLLKDKKIYLYCPTKRNSALSQRFNPQIDWEKLNASLLPNEIFIVNRHPFMNEEFFKKWRYRRVRDYTFEPTPELLAAADVLITDYSTVFYDACLLKVPTVFYCPDLDKIEQDFYLNIPEDLPGNTVFEPENLLDEIRNSLRNPPLEQAEAFRQKQLSACDGKATKRTVEIIEEWIKAN